MANHVRIHNSKIDYTIVRRKIKYPRLEFKTGKLLVVLPETHQGAEDLIEKHKNWVYEKDKLIQIALKDSKKKKLASRTEDEFKQLAKKIIKKISSEDGFQSNNVYFRRMKSKWGSCSVKKNLTLNTQMKYLPQTLIEYIICHEITHLIERKHSQHFWKTISKRFPTYANKEKDLLIYWFLIQQQT